MSNTKNSFAFDRTAFQAVTFEEANDHYGYWKNKSMKERLEAGAYLSMQMFSCSINTPMNKTVFDKRKHSNG
ncbi:MAG TPA: hypothetical protein PL045_08570 [Chitinophagaceae bacterium]|nr:hypothetical protein [Chitinophagaceae bacterium]